MSHIVPQDHIYCPATDLLPGGHPSAHGFTLGRESFVGGQTLPAVPEWLSLLLSCCGVYLFAIFCLDYLPLRTLNSWTKRKDSAIGHCIPVRLILYSLKALDCLHIHKHTTTIAKSCCISCTHLNVCY